MPGRNLMQEATLELLLFMWLFLPAAMNRRVTIRAFEDSAQGWVANWPNESSLVVLLLSYCRV